MIAGYINTVEIVAGHLSECPQRIVNRDNISGRTEPLRQRLVAIAGAAHVQDPLSHAYYSLSGAPNASTEL
jgi:hypothetical protein